MCPQITFHGYTRSPLSYQKPSSGFLRIDGGRTITPDPDFVYLASGDVNSFSYMVLRLDTAGILGKQHGDGSRYNILALIGRMIMSRIVSMTAGG